MSLKKLTNIVLVALIVCSLTLAASAEEKGDFDAGKIPNDKVLASLGDSKLTMQQVRWLTPTDDIKDLKRIVKAWLETEMLYLEATKEKLKDSPEVRFRAEMRIKQAYAAELIKKEQDKKKITMEELREHYDRYKYTDPMISSPASFGFFHIRSISKEKAQQALDRVNSGEEFSKVAAQDSVYSGDKVKGGRVKRMAERTVVSRFGAAFLKGLQDANDGEVFGPVLGKQNLWEVGKRENMKPPAAMPFEQVVKEVKPRLERADRTGAMLLLKHELKKKFKDIIFRDPIIQFDEEKEALKDKAQLDAVNSKP